MKCKKCSEELSVLGRFCSYCGALVLCMRSENEIKAQLNKFSQPMAFPNIASTALSLAMIQTLQWVVGGKEEPYELIRAASKDWEDASD